MGRKYHNIGCDGAAIDPEPLDYRLTKRGTILARVRCEQGHLLTQIVNPSPPPDDAAARQVYLSGAAVGFAIARHQSGTRLAGIVRRLVDRLPVRYTLQGVGELLGISVSELHRLYKMERPRPLSGVYRTGADTAMGFKHG